jgi:hypothetical protein
MRLLSTIFNNAEYTDGIPVNIATHNAPNSPEPSGHYPHKCGPFQGAEELGDKVGFSMEICRARHLFSLRFSAVSESGARRSTQRCISLKHQFPLQRLTIARASDLELPKPNCPGQINKLTPI